MDSTNHATQGQNHGGPIPAVDPQEFQEMRQAVCDLAQIARANNKNTDAVSGNTMSKVAKLRPEFFFGVEDPVILEDWIGDFEKTLDSVQCPEDQRLGIAVYHLKKKANHWWMARKEELLAQTGFGWTQLKAALRERFYPDHVKERKFREFQDLVQGSSSIACYYEKFIELMQFGGSLVPTEAKKIKKFQTGLDGAVKQTIGVFRFTTLNEAYSGAQDAQQILDDNAEAAKKRKLETPVVPTGGEKRFRSNINPNPSNQNINRSSGSNFPPRHFHCKGCGNNHPGLDCQGNRVTCRNCGKLGHRKFECRSAPLVHNNNGGNFNRGGGGGNNGNPRPNNNNNWNNNQRGNYNNQGGINRNYQQGEGYNNQRGYQAQGNNNYNNNRNYNNRGGNYNQNNNNNWRNNNGGGNANNNYGGGTSDFGGVSNRGNWNRGPEGHYHSRRYQPDHPGGDCQGMAVESHNRGKYCILEFDGASKGNPGPSGAGVVLRAESIGMVFRLRQGVGIGTCTVAEYRALILGLDYALKEGFTHIRAQGDSNLVCMQVQGLWRIKNQNIANLCEVAKELKDQFLSFEICHVERAFNSEADALANQAVYLQNEDVQVDSELMENGC